MSNRAEAAERALQHLQVLHDFAAALATGTGVEAMSSAIAARARPAFDAAAAYVWLLTTTGDAIGLTAASGYHGPALEPFREIALDRALPATEAVRSGHVVLLESASSRAARYPELGAGDEGHGAWAAVPLIGGHGTLGVLAMSFAEARQFAPDEVALMRTMAAQGAVALERARQIDAVERARASAEAALRTSEQRLQAIVDSAASPVYLKDLDGRYLMVNRRFAEEAGRRPEEIHGLTDHALFPPELADGFRADDARVAATGEALRLPHTFEWEGRRRAFYTVKFPVRDDEGHIYAIGGLSTDVSELEEARIRLAEESELNETLHRLGASFARERDVEVVARRIVDEAAALTHAHFAAFFGPGADDRRHQVCASGPSTGERLATLLAPRIAALVSGAADEILRCDNARTDSRLGALDPLSPGLPALRSWLAVSLRGRAGEALGTLFFADPVPGHFTGHHVHVLEGLALWATIALENARLLSSMTEAARRKDEFLAMLGHELRNPLAPITAALELMAAHGGAEKERSIIERQVRHLSRLVDDLLDVSRITRGKLVLERARVELATIVGKAVETATPLIERCGHRLTVEVPPSGVAVDADPIRMAQVVHNLLSNAARYTPEGGAIAVTAGRDARGAWLTVADDGIGIPADLMGILFEPFVQGDRTLDRRDGGLGIGLTLVKQVVELHGGGVEVASGGRGKGSAFTLRLPLAEGAPTWQPPPPMAPPAPARHARRVLLVDDNVDAAELLGHLLRGAGYDVAIAHDGTEALEVAARHRPDLAILDIGLPGIDGYELAGRMKALLGPSVRLLALSGYGQESDRQKSREAGFHKHLTKPVRVETVVAALEELVAQEPA